MGASERSRSAETWVFTQFGCPPPVFFPLGRAVDEFGVTNPADTFLLSAKLRDAHKWDLPELKRRIAESLPEVKRNKFLLSIQGYTEDLINQRREACREVRVIAASKLRPWSGVSLQVLTGSRCGGGFQIVRSHALLASANTGVNPIPVLSSAVTLGIIMVRRSL